MTGQGTAPAPEAGLTTVEGQPVTLRPIDVADLPAMRAMWARLSQQTIAMRFFGPVAMGEAELMGLVDVDGQNHVAIVAAAGDDIVGVGRFARLPDDPVTAEFGLTVEDAQQGRGIGRRLMAALIAHAAIEGLASLTCHVKADNTTMRMLLQGLPQPVSVREYGATVHATVAVPRDND